jgi:hypothetical protein
LPLSLSLDITTAATGAMTLSFVRTRMSADDVNDDGDARCTINMTNDEWVYYVWPVREGLHRPTVSICHRPTAINVSFKEKAYFLCVRRTHMYMNVLFALFCLRPLSSDGIGLCLHFPTD